MAAWLTVLTRAHPVARRSREEKAALLTRPPDWPAKRAVCADSVWWQEISLQLSRHRLFHSEIMGQNDISDHVPLY
jgi:hypothetical protein